MSTNQVEQLYYSLADAGKVLGLDRTTVFRLVKQGKLDAIAIPGERKTYRVEKKSLEAFIKDCKMQPEQEASARRKARSQSKRTSLKFIK